MVIHVWAALAWADGRLAPVEEVALRRLIDEAPLTAEEHAIAMGWLEHRVELDTSCERPHDLQERLIVYRAAVKLAVIDWEVTTEELQFLKRLRKWLEIDDAQAQKVEEAVLGTLSAGGG